MRFDGVRQFGKVGVGSGKDCFGELRQVIKERRKNNV